MHAYLRLGSTVARDLGRSTCGSTPAPHSNPHGVPSADMLPRAGWRPRPAAGLVVVESGVHACRAIAVVRERDEVRVEAMAAVASGEPLAPSVVHGLLRALASPFTDAVLVSPEARPAVRSGPSEPGEGPPATPSPDRLAVGRVLDPRAAAGASPGVLVTSLALARRARWERTFAAVGARLLGTYPLAGTALAGIRLDAHSPPLLVLQLEAASITLIESVAASCRGLETYDEPPTSARCGELIGDGCPEVALCGGGADLSRLGYELVRTGRTWVTLPRVHAAGSPLPDSFAAMIGAARHAWRLAPADAVACVPASDFRPGTGYPP